MSRFFLLLVWNMSTIGTLKILYVYQSLFHAMNINLSDVEKNCGLPYKVKLVVNLETKPQNQFESSKNRTLFMSMAFFILLFILFLLLYCFNSFICVTELVGYQKLRWLISWSGFCSLVAELKQVFKWFVLFKLSVYGWYPALRIKAVVKIWLHLQ